MERLRYRFEDAARRLRQTGLEEQFARVDADTSAELGHEPIRTLNERCLSLEDQRRQLNSHFFPILHELERRAAQAERDD